MYTEHDRHGTSGDSFHEALITEQDPEDDGRDPELELLMTAWKEMNDSDAEDVAEMVLTKTRPRRSSRP